MFNANNKFTLSHAYFLGFSKKINGVAFPLFTSPFCLLKSVREVIEALKISFLNATTFVDAASVKSEKVLYLITKYVRFRNHQAHH